MIQDMASADGIQRRTVLRVFHRAVLEVSHRPGLISQPHHNLTILTVQFRNIPHAHQSLQVLCGGPRNALVECQSTWLISRGAWEHLQMFEAQVKATGVSGRFVYGFRTDSHFADEDNQPACHVEPASHQEQPPGHQDEPPWYRYKLPARLVCV
jgi:hypothetical protein